MTEHQHSSAAARELCQGKSWPDAGAANPRSALGTQLPTLAYIARPIIQHCPCPIFWQTCAANPFYARCICSYNPLVYLCLASVSSVASSLLPSPSLSSQLHCLGDDSHFSKPLLVLVPNIHIGRILFHKPQNCKSPAVLSPPPSTYICVCRIGCI